MPYLIENPEATKQQIHELRFCENTIGRETDNSIIVIDGSVSRHHAKITIAGDRIFIEDLNSRNYTFVNDNKIEQCELKDGDIIRCGNVVFKLVNTPENRAPATRDNTNSNIPIVKRLSPEQTRVIIQELLQQESSENQGSVLMLRQQNVERRAIDKLKILLEASKQLSSPEEPDILLEKILDLLFKIMSVDRAIILMVNEETGQLERKAAKFRPGIPTEEHYSTKIANFVQQNGDAVLTSDARIDKRFDNSESIITQAIHASMCVPLKPREKVIGVLYADNLSMTNVYLEEDLEFLTALVNQAAIAIDNAQLYKKMQAEAVVRAKLERFFPEAVSKKIKEEGNLEIVETEVTALFSDITGYTEMSSTMSPRQAIEMLNEYFKVMVEEIVFPYEGTLDKYMGDGLLAVWGAPYQQIDDADRAVKAAIAMQWALCRLNEEWVKQGRLQISIHIGLNTGKVAAGNIGSQKLIQYTAIGDTMNVASRICSAAKGDEILISTSTLEKLGDRTVPVEKIPPVMVKGKDRPLHLYRVLWQQVKLPASIMTKANG